MFLDVSSLVNITGLERDLYRNQNLTTNLFSQIRSAISTVCSSVYVAVLTNRLGQTIPAEVPPAVIAAGLPASSVPAYLGGFTTGNFTSIPGLTPDIATIGARAYKVANSHAYSTVFYTTIAFSGIAVIIVGFFPI